MKQLEVGQSDDDEGEQNNFDRLGGRQSGDPAKDRTRREDSHLAREREGEKKKSDWRRRRWARGCRQVGCVGEEVEAPVARVGRLEGAREKRAKVWKS